MIEHPLIPELGAGEAHPYDASISKQVSVALLRSAERIHHARWCHLNGHSHIDPSVAGHGIDADFTRPLAHPGCARRR